MSSDNAPSSQPPAPQPPQPGANANYSDLGEEDPGAALDSPAPPPAAGDAVAAAQQPLRAQRLQRALARWQHDDGTAATALAPDEAGAAPASAAGPSALSLTNAELVQLQLRVIALENLVTALLANAPAPTLELADAMAGYIAPRPGFTAKHLTQRAAAHMRHLSERAQLFRPPPPGE